MKIQNYENSFNNEYNESKMVSVYHKNLKLLNNKSYNTNYTTDKGVFDTNWSSSKTETSKNKSVDYIKKYVKTQNNKELSKLLMSSCSSSISRKSKSKKSQMMKSSTNPLSNKEVQYITDSTLCERTMAPQIHNISSKAHTKKRKEYNKGICIIILLIMAMSIALSQWFSFERVLIIFFSWSYEQN